MKTEIMPLARALEQARQEPYAYIIRLSSVYTGPTPGEFDAQELLEARFFGPRREIRICQEDDALTAVLLEEEEDDLFLEDTVETRDPRFGHCLTLRRYIVYDEDGQASIGASRLTDWKGVEYGQQE